MSLKFRRIFVVISALLIAFNVGIFLFVHLKPIYWIHNETLLHRFFWSMDGIDQYSLHTGLTKQDWIKPLASNYIDGLFRLRFFSYFVEMVSFKFWQFLGIGFIRNYTLIIIHLINVALLGTIVYSISKVKQAAWISMLLLLNSGIAMATLLFPFRNAKLLVVTLFLVNFVLIVRSPGNFYQSSRRRLGLFFLVLFLLFLTDEISFFICPILFLYIAVKDGCKGLFNKRLLMGISFVLSFDAAFIYFAAHHPLNLPQMVNDGGNYQKYFAHMINYSFHWRTYQDIGRAFFSYFLRRDFGYWDFSLFGITAFISSLVLFAIVFISLTQKKLIFERKICLIVTGVMLFKSVTLAHDSGVHPILMPPNTYFPSLFFFSYYYPYCETVLIALMIGFMLSRIVENQWGFASIVFLISIISLSNAVHLKNGPTEALVFHDWGLPEQQQVIKNIIKIDRFLDEHPNDSAYLSFPAGGQKVFKGRMHDGLQYIIARIIPIKYLRAIEKERVFISLETMSHRKDEVNPSFELLTARYFIDVMRNYYLDLIPIKKELGMKDLPVQHIAARDLSSHEFNSKLSDLNKQLFFLIKGEAKFIITVDKKNIAEEQIYGQSYELFLFHFTARAFQSPASISIRILPKDPDSDVSIAGPFLIKDVNLIQFK